MSAAMVAGGAVTGVLFASLLTHASGMLGRYSVGAAVRDWTILIAGAVLGGALFSWAGRR